jgi:simple sugar transport system permease protein
MRNTLKSIRASRAGAEVSRRLLDVLIPLLSIVLSFLVGAVVILWSGGDPVLAYGVLVEGALGGGKQIAMTLAKSIPFLFTGLAMTLAFRGGVWNIGAEGQLQVAAIFSVLAGTRLELPPVAHVTVALLAGIVGGALWALLPALLKTYRNFNVVITTVLFSYIGVGLTDYLVGGPLKQVGFVRQTDPILPSAWLPNLVPGTNLHAGFILGVVFVVLVYVLLSQTTLGYQIRAVGFNERAAKAAGIKIERVSILVFLLSGALAGLAGTNEVIGYNHVLVANFSPGYGWDGIAVSLLGGMNPFGTLLAAIFFGALRVGGNAMQVVVGMPGSVIQLLQGLTVLFTLAGVTIRAILAARLGTRSVEGKSGVV